ncbi:Gfo/Idh/MocA family protein [Enterococcus sp. AZ072]|uniref:Gfo/Idh/MocA family protein n=1 Tax=unclassified Enterococcus TaxID=2608891 RepID=UPI003D29D7BB
MKLGIVGAGMIVKDFLTVTPDLPQIELSAILSSERSLEKNKELQTAHGIKAIFTDYSDFLREGNFDTVYIALPNHLHYQYALEALIAGKHVICEKPFTMHLQELQDLQEKAREKDLLLFEAITNQYLGNFRRIKEHLDKIAPIHLISCNYSQYSSRYDAFKKGEVPLAFDPAAGGGALMDINIYNLHIVVGLLGEPRIARYFPNYQRGVDTSGVVMMDYGQAKAVCVGSKDTDAESYVRIQGEAGEIIVKGPTNSLKSGYVKLRSGVQHVLNNNVHTHRMYEEFHRFAKAIDQHDIVFANEKMRHSLEVMSVLEKTRS